MDIKTITGYDDFLGLRSAWNKLLESTDADSVFLRHEWFDCWWQAFGGNKRMNILAAYEGRELAGIAPFMATPGTYRGLPVRLLEFIQDANSARCDLIVQPGRTDLVRGLLAHCLKQRNPTWDILRLKNVPRESWTPAAIAAAAGEQGIPAGAIPGLASPYIRINTDWDTYYAAKSSKFRKTMRNVINRIERLGNVVIREITSIEQRPDIVETIAGISRKSWKGTCAGDLGRTQENRQFFDLLSAKAQESGWLSIWLLTARTDDKPLAYEYHLNYKGAIFAMRADFDAAYENASPGSLLEYTIIQKAFQSGIREYDLCGNDYAYKMRWTDDVRRHTTLELFNRGPYPRLLHAIQYRLRPALKKMLKRKQT